MALDDEGQGELVAGGRGNERGDPFEVEFACRHQRLAAGGDARAGHRRACRPRRRRPARSSRFSVNWSNGVPSAAEVAIAGEGLALEAAQPLLDIDAGSAPPCAVRLPTR